MVNKNVIKELFYILGAIMMLISCTPYTKPSTGGRLDKYLEKDISAMIAIHQLPYESRLKDGSYISLNKSETRDNVRYTLIINPSHYRYTYVYNQNGSITRSYENLQENILKTNKYDSQGNLSETEDFPVFKYIALKKPQFSPTQLRAMILDQFGADIEHSKDVTSISLDRDKLNQNKTVYYINLRKLSSEDVAQKIVVDADTGEIIYQNDSTNELFNRPEYEIYNRELTMTCGTPSR